MVTLELDIFLGTPSVLINPVLRVMIWIFFSDTKILASLIGMKLSPTFSNLFAMLSSVAFFYLSFVLYLTD